MKIGVRCNILLIVSIKDGLIYNKRAPKHKIKTKLRSIEDQSEDKSIIKYNFEIQRVDQTIFSFGVLK